MLNLIEQGLAIQAASIPHHNSDTVRDVCGYELFHDVFLEAIEVPGHSTRHGFCLHVQSIVPSLSPAVKLTRRQHE